MMSMKPSEVPLIGSILERKPRSTPSAPSPKLQNGSGKTGFPAVQHRSKSAFSRSREEQKRNIADKAQQVPVVQSTPKGDLRAPEGAARSSIAYADDWRSQVDEENRKRVEAMSEEEREEERREILERFGPNVSEVLRKAKEAREAQQQPPRSGQEENNARPVLSLNPEQAAIQSPTSQAASLFSTISKGSKSRSASPPSAMSRPGSRPSSRADRNVRFADVTPNDIYVYESAPPSPRRKPLALLSPTEADGPTISLGEWKSKTKPFCTPGISELPAEERSSDAHDASIHSLEEGTPEDIRRRFFPNAPAHDPSLAWMESDPTSQQSSLPSSSALRFDLTGTPIPPELSSALPTHLGLHHHADGDHAGYTLDDIFLLSRSTVPAQRASMLGVLGRIARRLFKGRRKDSSEGIVELTGQEADIRKRILAAGVEAMAERGSLGARAIEAMRECIVGWDEEVIDIEGVELQSLPRTDSSPASTAPTSEDDPLSTLPLDYVLSQISSALATAALPTESLTQLLAILHRLAQHSNSIASTIVTTPGLLPNILQTFLLTPIPPTENTLLPDPFALQLLTTLALASRTNAFALLGPADALLRFVTTLPPASPFPLPLATSLLVGTLRLYTVFASYGMYSHIATTASEYFARVTWYVLSEACRSKQLKEAWLGLLEAWMVCARDPHRTTPSHEILWSQVVSWSWGEDVLEMRKRLTEQDEALWTAVWRAEAAWLEGARVNSVRGGESERSSALAVLTDGFQSGIEQRVVKRAGQRLSELLGGLGVDSIRIEVLPRLQEIAAHAMTLASALRLWLSCLPSQLPGPPESPPFLLPFRELSELCAQITTHSIWRSMFTAGSLSYAHVFYRPLSLLLSSYVRLSRWLPDTTEGLWMAQAFVAVCRLLPGDDETALSLMEDAASLITPVFMGSSGWKVPSIVWEKGGMVVIRPFLSFSLQPKEDLAVGPVWISPKSISVAATQRLPSALSIRPDTRHNYSLPLPRDWMFLPLDHLLRSGESEVFKHMPSSWDASETEIVRAVFLLAKVTREVLLTYGLVSFLMTREETVFACMKVFMLEHGQQQNDSTEEVFRDSTVGQFMEELISPFAAGVLRTSLLLPSPEETQHNLETVAARFLGPSTPFYQFYTDFVGLYDAISFAHPLFGRLLLPPLSMRYPLDYRKLIWADYGHILKTIRTPVEAVITGNVGEYLWPVEGDAHVVGSYLKALVKGTVDGFVRLVAVHHIACNIWSDLCGSREDKATKLLQALIDQAGFDAIREVVLYRQVREGTIFLPPHCFAQTGDWKTARLGFIERVGGDKFKERFGLLLEQS